MKKNTLLTICLALAALMSLAGIACAQETKAPINYGESKLYTNEEIDAAAEVIMAEFSGWEGCEMHLLEYAGDAQSLNELEYIQENYQEPYDECMVFISAFRSPKEAYAAWEADQEYVWSWCLARADKGEWKALTWGWAESFIASDLYTMDEVISAVDIIRAEVDRMEGVKLHLVRYSGDEISKSALEYINSLERGTFDECAVFSVWLQSPKDAYGAWEPDQLYTWTWFLGRADKGEWQIITYGF